jgi:hypothetical protein
MFSISINTAEMKKRGQTTVFIILAIVIVVFGILIYFLYPKISTVLGLDSEPNSYMQSCIEPSVKEGLSLLAKQGGYTNPEGYILYNGEKIKYLCYTAQYYVPCYVQQPMIRAKFEQELAQMVQSKADECAQDLKKYYEDRGYEVTGGGNALATVAIVSDDVSVFVSAPMTITKDTVQRFDNFRVSIPSKMYSLLLTATSIIDFESTYGGSETTLYMQYYPNLKIQKTKLMDGSTVYTISDVTSEESFSFASRSLAWPPGYGLVA